MRTKSILVLVVVAIVCIAIPQALALTEYNDGDTYDIATTINDEVWVDYQSPGEQTTVNWLTGASIPHPYDLSVYEDGRLNIYDGSIGHVLSVNDRSQVNVSGGSINDFVVVSDNSRINISGGAIAYEFYAENSSQATISDGSIGDYLVATDSSYIDISGGSIDNYLRALESSQVTISGGSIGQYLWAEGSQVEVFGGAVGGELRATWSPGIIIYGLDFAVDGQPIGYDELSSIFGTDYRDEPFRHLTGTLASGELIDNDFRIGHNAQIILVPEPSTLLLLGLGAVILIRKR